MLTVNTMSPIQQNINENDHENGYEKRMTMRNECDELQHHNKENRNDAYNNKQDNMHNNVNTNDDVDTLHIYDYVTYFDMH